VFASVASERGDSVVDWVPAEAPPPAIDGFDAVFVLGGGMHLDEEAAHPWMRREKRLLRELLTQARPTLGVCLGAQLLAEAAGGSAARAPWPEIGWLQVRLTGAARSDPVLASLPAMFESFQWHSYEISLPPDAVALAHSAACVQAFRLASAPVWGIQFHAEVTAETVGGWLRDYGREPDAVRAGLDEVVVRARTDAAIGRWNELGRVLCRAFLDYAATHARAAQRGQEVEG
jgi:GMP synthase-like glutamine amidotransferase